MNRFAKMPIEAAMDSRLSKSDLRVLIALLSFCRKELLCYPKKQAISDVTGLPTNKIAQATARLKSLGWLKKFGNGGRQSPAHYQILNPLKTSTESVLETSTKSVPPPRKNQYRIGTKTSTEVVLPKEQSINREEPPYSPPRGTDETAWRDLDFYKREHRSKRVRESWTQLAMEKAAGLLAELTPIGQRRCVDMTIANGWQGIFPERIRNERLKAHSGAEEINPIRQIYEDIALADEMGGRDLREDASTLQWLMDKASGREQDRDRGADGGVGEDTVELPARGIGLWAGALG